MKLNSTIGLLALFSVLGCTAQKDVKKYRNRFPVFIPVWLIIIMKANVERGRSCLGRIVYG